MTRSSSESQRLGVTSSISQVNSAPTITALDITGMKVAINKCLQGIIAKQPIKVAPVPINKSQGPAIESNKPKAFEIRHPTVNPMIYAGLKKTKMFNISEILKFSNP